jgi:glycosyltransferase involved in cell wall biosynthesis
MDLFVHLPDLEEGLGRTVLEAQAAGVPVLCWPRGGLVDAVRDGETGAFVRDGDVGAAAEAAVALLRAPERRQALAEAAVRHARKRFTSAHCARRVEAAYDEVLR